MNCMHRATSIAAVCLLLLLGSTAFAPPVFRPPPVRPPVRPPTFRPPSSPFRPPTTMPGSFTGIRPGTFTGRIPSSPVITRTPAQITGEVRGLMNTRPAGVFAALSRPDARTLLNNQTRVNLGLEAAHKLAIKVESSGGAAKTLHEVRSAQQAASSLPAEVRTRLDQVARTAERRALVEGLDNVRGPMERGQWRQASAKAQQWLKEMGEAKRALEKSVEFVQSPRSGRLIARRTPESPMTGEVRGVLEEVRGVNRQLETLDVFEMTVKEFDVKTPAESATRLAQIDRASLPKQLQRPAEGLRGLAEVKALTQTRWTEPPQIARIKEAVARLERGLADVGKADAQLGPKLMQEMAVKAHLEGHTEAYFKLIPENGPPEHAANLLRDLKALTLGEGKVSTEVASATLSKPAAAPASPRAPPGVEPLIPEGAKSSWRPPIKESAKADLPPLAQASEAGAALKAKAQANVKPQRTMLENQAQTVRQKLTDVYQRVTALQVQERIRFAEIEADLERRLNAEEHVRVRVWLEQKHSIEQIIKQLGAQPDQDDGEAEFLRDVEKRLARVLTPAEVEQTKHLRRAGRTAAEVADLLR